MSLVIEPGELNAPIGRQVNDSQGVAIPEKIERLRRMQAFFRTLPDNRGEAGLGPIDEDVRELAYKDREDKQL